MTRVTDVPYTIIMTSLELFYTRLRTILHYTKATYDAMTTNYNLNATLESRTNKLYNSLRAKGQHKTNHHERYYTHSVAATVVVVNVRSRKRKREKPIVAIAVDKSRYLT